MFHLFATQVTTCCINNDENGFLMTLGLSADERIARARADLRMGVPVVLRGETGAVVFVSAETLTPERLSALAGFGPELTLTITARRAETLNAFVYDGDIARLKVPSHACANWIKSVSDPADDLNNPMKGPFTAIRGGDPKLHRLAIGVVKSARLRRLPKPVTSSRRRNQRPSNASLKRRNSARLRSLRTKSAELAPARVATGTPPPYSAQWPPSKSRLTGVR